MTIDIAIVLGLLAVAILFFAMEWLPVDAITLFLIVSLVVTGVLTPGEAFSGFANEMVVILASVFVLSGAMVKSGVMDGLGRLIQRFGGVSDRRGAGALLTLSAVTSAFFSNTVATAVMMPAVLRNSREAGISPSKFLMPVAYASILGGTCTLIGTSTNLAGSAMAVRLGLEPFSMFEFAGIGLMMAIAGVLWLVFFGGRLLPERARVDPLGDYDRQLFLSALIVPEGSRAQDRRVHDLKLGAIDVHLLSIIRDGQRHSPNHSRKVRSGDKLIVRAPRENLLKAKSGLGLEIDANRYLEGHEREGDEMVMAEAVVLPQSNLVGRTLRQLNIPGRFGSTVVAIHRPGRARPAEIENLRLRVGDVLLLQGTRQNLARLSGNTNLWGLIEVETKLLSRPQAALILGLVATALILSAAGVIALSIGLLSAVLLLAAARIITMEEAYRSIEWRLLILIAGLTSFGGAMIKTGAADLVASGVVEATMPYGTTVSMAAFALLTVLLTQPMSNAAAALTVLPVAVASANALGVDPRSMAILVTLSASLSFITPLEPACLLVYGPGRYRFKDYARAGLPLTAICLVFLLALVPVFWPL
ncbi:MAG: SLC13 family permease [Paracoccaceae bacterium]|nr:SLC13 family permease [Paracoccaceae bacterium]